MKRSIPNIITLCNGLVGVISIIAILNNKISFVPYFFAIALLCDFLDGMVARLLKTSSALGRELDSLCDVISFGVLPATLIAYMLNFYDNIPNIIIYLSALYPLFTIYRLSIFNVKFYNLSYFVGLSSPMAAVFVITIFFLNQQWFLPWYLYLFINLLIAIFMVLPLHFYNFKDLQKTNLGKVILITILLTIIIFFIIFSWISILIFSIIYLLISLLLENKKVKSKISTKL
jgi:CDP-diacylglycerol--serine O-phosphatidyltransferase